MNVSNNKAGKYAEKYFRPPSIYICCGDEERQLTVEQYEDLPNNLC